MHYDTFLTKFCLVTFTNRRYKSHDELQRSELSQIANILYHSIWFFEIVIPDLSRLIATGRDFFEICHCAVAYSADQAIVFDVFLGR